MEKLFDNLILHEIVLLLLGVFLFMILCGILVFYVIKKQKIKKLMLFFMIPIIMIGYPSIQEIKIGKDWISFEKYKQELVKDPNNEEAKEELLALINKLGPRAKASEDCIELTEAFILLDKPEKAIKWADKAIESKSTSQDLVLINDLKLYATIQKDIKDNPSILKDTMVLINRINKLKDPTIMVKFDFNNKYINTNTRKIESFKNLDAIKNVELINN